ncbi:MAG TPA: hypothetical protein ENN63_04180 [Bacteroidetes bacterium]|nr:hypothetical protein [Bacteroidota bacterium]
MEKLRRGKACRDPNPSLTVQCLSGTQTGSLHRPSHFFPRLVSLIKPSEACPFNEIRGNTGTLFCKSGLPAATDLPGGIVCVFGGKAG